MHFSNFLSLKSFNILLGKLKNSIGSKFPEEFEEFSSLNGMEIKVQVVDTVKERASEFDKGVLWQRMHDAR